MYVYTCTQLNQFKLHLNFTTTLRRKNYQLPLRKRRREWYSYLPKVMHSYKWQGRNSSHHLPALEIVKGRT